MKNWLNIYSSSLNKKGEWSKKPIRLESPINTDHHEGPLYLNQNGTTMFFTTCQSENKKKQDFSISFFSAVTQRIFKIFF